MTEIYTGCVREKLYNFQFLITEKVNKAQQQYSGGQSIIFLCVKKVFKWYHSIIRCKSYGPMSDEW